MNEENRPHISMTFEIDNCSDMSGSLDSEKIEDALAQTMWDLGYAGSVHNKNGNDTAIRDFNLEKSLCELTEFIDDIIAIDPDWWESDQLKKLRHVSINAHNNHVPIVVMTCACDMAIVPYPELDDVDLHQLSEIISEIS